MSAHQVLADLAASHPHLAAPAAPGQLPEGVLVGHRHTYRTPTPHRSGSAYVQADGRVTEKAKGGGRRHEWAERNAAALVWVHAPYECEACR